MYNCPICKSPLKFKKESDLIIRCDCNRFCRLKIKSKTNIEQLYGLAKSIDVSHFAIKEYEDTVLICAIFDLGHIGTYSQFSKKTSNALRRLIDEDKGNLSKKEKDLLYKLKSTSISKLEEKINIIRSQIDCIKFLMEMDF